MTAASTALAAAVAEVAVVVSDDSPIYRQVAEAVRSELLRGQAQISVRVLPVRAPNSLPEENPQAIVAVGARAVRALSTRETRAPVLSALVPRRTFERIAAESGRSADLRQFSALYMDQPLARQLELIRLALPGASRVALLLGPESGYLSAAAQTAGAERHLRVSVQKASAEAEIHPLLQKLLGDTDVLLALPDAAIFNNNTLPHILLATYRQRIPVVGFSAAFARAGAVLALHSTPEQLGRQAAEMLRAALASGQLPPPQFPREFVVSTNPHVARSLEIVIEDAEVLTRKLMQAEGR